MTLSISAEVAMLEDSQQKNYAWTMETHGLEMGFAKGGLYSAHAHRNLVDVVFAPGGMEVGLLGSGENLSGTLLVALPGTWFGPVRAADFFFIKFYRDQKRVGVPDKVIEGSSQAGDIDISSGGLIVAQSSAVFLVPFFNPRHPSNVGTTAEILLTDGDLLCRFGGSSALLVMR
jgi:hypothetical protein